MHEPVSPKCAFNGKHDMVSPFVWEPFCEPKVGYLHGKNHLAFLRDVMKVK